MTTDRPLWRHSIYQTAAQFETNRLLYETKIRQFKAERRGRYINLSTSPVHLAPPAHTAITSVYQELGS